MTRKRLLQLSPGEEVFAQGELANSVFYVSSGQLFINIEGPQKCKTIAQLQQGDFLGEHCLGNYPRRPNTAMARVETLLFEYDKHEMLETLEVEPKVREMFIRNLIDQKFALEMIFVELLNL